MTTVSTTPPPVITPTSKPQPVTPPAGQGTPVTPPSGEKSTGEVGGPNVVITGSYPEAGAPNVLNFPAPCSGAGDEVSDPTAQSGEESEVSEPSDQDPANEARETSVGGDIRVRSETNNGQTTEDINARGGVYYGREYSDDAQPGQTRRYGSLRANITAEYNRREQSGAPGNPGAAGTEREDGTLRGQVIYTVGEQRGVIPNSQGLNTGRDLEQFLDGNGGRQ